jgi:hypothetical protein
MSAPDEAQRPLLRVVGGGEPTDEELAALTVAVTTLASAAEAADRPKSRWNDRRSQLRHPLYPGPGAWVAAARR